MGPTAWDLWLKAWVLEPGAWSLGSGARSLGFLGLVQLGPDAWSLGLGLGLDCEAWGLGVGSLDTWGLEPGAWFLDPGAWIPNPATKGNVPWSLDPGPWSLELGTWIPTLGAPGLELRAWNLEDIDIYLFISFCVVICPLSILVKPRETSEREREHLRSREQQWGITRGMKKG